MDTTQRNFEALIKQELGQWPQGAVLELQRNGEKQPDVERDHYICTVKDVEGQLIGVWSGVEKQKLNDPVSSFSVVRRKD